MRYADIYCECEEVFSPTHGYKFTGPCIVTARSCSVFVPANELFAYRQGELIQDAMPSVSPDDREFLISGMSPEGWKQTFGDNDE